MLLDRAKARQYTSPGHLAARMALHRRFTPAGHSVADFLWARYSFARRAHVLEVGCGTGEFWLSPSARLQDGLRLMLTDRSAGMVTRTRVSLHALPVERHFAVADLAALPFDSGSFDVTLAHYMLYHTADRVRALQELKRVVRPGGWLGIALTGPANMSRIVDMLVQAVPELAIAPRDSSAFHVSVADPLIRSVFPSVHRHDYEYTMNVTEPEFVVAYAQSLSTVQAANLTTGQWQQYGAAVAEDIRTTGSFRVVKSASLFMCRP